jgi:hypothetical protein
MKARGKVDAKTAQSNEALAPSGNGVGSDRKLISLNPLPEPNCGGLSVEWGKSLGRALVVFRQHAHGPNNRSASAPHPIT